MPESPIPTHARASYGRALGWMFAILGLVYFPLFLGRIFFFRDIAHWIFPARWLLRESFRRGEIPLWNPYQGLGFPVLGNPLYGVFYPPNWLFALVPEGWVGNLLSGLDFAHLAFGGAGVFLLARRLKAAPIAAGVALLAWSLSGYTSSQWTAGLRLHAGAWIPWIALGQLALQTSLGSGPRRWCLGVVQGALPLACALLLGEPFLATMGVLFALALVVMTRPTMQLPLRLRFRPVAAVTLSLLLGGCVGAVTLLPARAAMSGSDRSAVLPRAVAEQASLHPLSLIEFVAPGCMGNPYGDYPAGSIVGEPSLDRLPLSYSVYMGASILGLVLIAFRRRGTLAFGFAGVTLFALALALGRHLPLHAVFRRVVFPLGYMRFPEKYLVLVVAGLALLAGLGATRVLAGGRQPYRRVWVLLILLVLAAGLAPFVFPFPWSGYMMRGLRDGALALLALLGVQWLAARGSRLAAPLLVIVVSLDLATAVFALQGFAPRTLPSAQPPAGAAIRNEAHGQAEPPRLYRAESTTSAILSSTKAANHTEGESRLLLSMVTNTPNRWDIGMVPGYDAAIPSRFTQVWSAGIRHRRDALRLLGVDFALLPAPGGRGPLDSEARSLLDPLPGVRLYGLADSLPRAYVAGRGEILPDAEILPRLFEAPILAGEKVYLSPMAGLPPLPEHAGRPGTCSITSYSPRSVRATCHTERDALAVFVEQHDPGWHAKVDGQAAQVLRANLAMRAVSIPTGQHLVEWTYQAPGLRSGASLTMMALLLLLAIDLLYVFRPPSILPSKRRRPSRMV